MDKETIETLWEEFRTPHHVRKHCEQVALVGEWLAKKLLDKGESINPKQVWTAGMLHDMVRVVDFKTLDPQLGSEDDQKIWKALRKQYEGQHHADVAAQILNERGEHELARIIQKHRYRSINSDDPPQTWEEKLLYYADKRVAHDKIVGLMERLEEARKRHRPGVTMNEEDRALREANQKLEKEIFQKIGLNPNDILK